MCSVVYVAFLCADKIMLPRQLRYPHHVEEEESMHGSGDDTPPPPPHLPPPLPLMPDFGAILGNLDGRHT